MDEIHEVLLEERDYVGFLKLPYIYDMSLKEIEQTPFLLKNGFYHENKIVLWIEVRSKTVVENLGDK